MDSRAQQEAWTTGTYFRPGTTKTALYAFVEQWLGPAQRHYQATGDWQLATIAAGRGVVRWFMFAMLTGIHLFLFVALAVTPLVMVKFATASESAAAETGVSFQPHIQTPGETVRLLLIWGLPWVLSWASFPFSLGVYFIRCCDRSLFRMQGPITRRIRRWLVPFAYRVRTSPDFVLFVLPVALWFAGAFTGTILGSVIAPLIEVANRVSTN